LDDIAALLSGKRNFSKPGVKNLVLVEGVRLPFCVAGTDYKNAMPHDLARGAIQYVLATVIFFSREWMNDIFQNNILLFSVLMDFPFEINHYCIHRVWTCVLLMPVYLIFCVTFQGSLKKDKYWQRYCFSFCCIN